jgi:hypothetical protein
VMRLSPKNRSHSVALTSLFPQRTERDRVYRLGRRRQNASVLMLYFQSQVGCVGAKEWFVSGLGIVTHSAVFVSRR